MPELIIPELVLPALTVPVWIWINAVILIAAGTFVWGKLSGEGALERAKSHQAGPQRVANA